MSDPITPIPPLATPVPRPVPGPTAAATAEAFEAVFLGQMAQLMTFDRASHGGATGAELS